MLIREIYNLFLRNTYMLYGFHTSSNITYYLGDTLVNLYKITKFYIFLPQGSSSTYSKLDIRKLYRFYLFYMSVDLSKNFIYFKS